MTNLEGVDTEVLKTIFAAYTAYYGRELTEEESLECKKTIELIKLEIESRKEEIRLANNNKTDDNEGWFMPNK